MSKNESGCCCVFDENDNIISMCNAHQIEVGQAYQTAFEASERLKPKPLTWKTGPVPEDFEGLILCEMKADESPYFVVAMATGEIVHCIFPSHKNDVLRWLPLSEILALIANQTGTDRQSDGGE